MNKYNDAIDKIHNAYDEFKAYMISMDSKEIYEYAYKIYCINEMYEYLINVCDFTDKVIADILDFRGNILLHIYDEWINHETGRYDEYCEFIKLSLNNISEKRCDYAA